MEEGEGEVEIVCGSCGGELKIAILVIIIKLRIRCEREGGREGSLTNYNFTATDGALWVVSRRC